MALKHDPVTEQANNQFVGWFGTQSHNKKYTSAFARSPAPLDTCLQQETGRRPTNSCRSQTLKRGGDWVSRPRNWGYWTSVTNRHSRDSFWYCCLNKLSPELIFGLQSYSSYLHTCSFHALHMWLILETPELCSKVSYASSQFFVGSAVLRNETEIMTNKGPAVASPALGNFGSTNNLFERNRITWNLFFCNQ